MFSPPRRHRGGGVPIFGSTDPAKGVLMARYGNDGVGARRYRAPAPAPAFRFRVPGGQKATATYAELVKAWRAGVIQDFYYGSRADDDPTLIWLVDGVEFARTDLAGVAERLSELSRRAGVESISFGETWCGYRALVVTFTGGVVVTQRYDGCSVIESAERESAVA